MQGMSWILRRAVSYSAVQLHITSTTDASQKVHIDIEQTSTGGFKNNEERVLDWEWREATDAIFGKVKGRTRWCDIKEIDDEFLREGWDAKSLEEAGGEVVNAYVESVGLKGEQWTADQVWGFEVLDGLRRHVRHIVAKRGKEVHRVKVIYDWVGPSEK